MKQRLIDIGDAGSPIHLREMKEKYKEAKGIRDKVKRLSKKRLKALKSGQEHVKVVDIIGVWATLEAEQSEREKILLEGLLTKITERQASISQRKAY